jgi:mRNA interferase RelE/StbE
VSYEVLLSRTAEKSLTRKIPAERAEQLRNAIDALAEDPRPRSSRKMRGTGTQEEWRARVGDYRIIYRIEEPHPNYSPERSSSSGEEGQEEQDAGGEEQLAQGLVLVLDVGHRGSVYG